MKRCCHILLQFLILLGIIISTMIGVSAQNSVVNQAINLKSDEKNPKMIGLADALKICKAKYGVDIWYVNKMVDGLFVSSDILDSKESVEVVLGRILGSVGLKFKKIKPNIYGVIDERRRNTNKINDCRTDFTFLTNWYRNDGVNPVTYYVTYPIIVPDSTSLTREQLPYFNKHHDPLGYDVSNNENDEYLICLAEVYIIKAEAKRIRTNTSSNYSFNKIRARLANCCPRKAPFDLKSGLSKYDFRMAVYNERGIELTGEFGRWFEDVRLQYQNSGNSMFQWSFDTFYPSLAASSLMPLPQWDTKTKKWNPVVNGLPQGGGQPLWVPEWKVKCKLFPIPDTELAANGNFGGQNPGW